MTHYHEKIDFTAEVFIVYKGKVLLRKHDKYKLWLSVGGHIDLDEDPNQAAIREVKEEVGLDVELIGSKPEFLTESDSYKELIPPRFLNRHRISDSHEHVCLVYYAKTNGDKLLLSEEEKTDECKWFALEELDDEIFDIKDSIKHYAKGALKALGDSN